MAFQNTPGTNTYTTERIINGKKVIFEFRTEAHHIYTQKVFNDSVALKAMQDAGLWHGDDFRVNGIQLASKMRVVTVGGMLLTEYNPSSEQDARLLSADPDQRGQAQVFFLKALRKIGESDCKPRLAVWELVSAPEV